MNIKFLVLLFFGITLIRCHSYQRMGDNDIEGFKNKKISFIDYSKRNELFKPLKGLFLKVDKINYEGNVSDAFSGYPMTGENYSCSINLAVGYWKGKKNDLLDSLYQSQFQFYISTYNNVPNNIYNNQKELFINSCQNKDSTINEIEGLEFGFLKSKKEPIFYTSCNNKCKKDKVTFYFKEKIVTFESNELNVLDHDVEWLSNYIFYNLLGGVAFESNDEKRFLIPD